MATFSDLEIGLSFVCVFVLLGCAGELYYLLWWKKRRADIENQKSSFSSCSSKNTPTLLASYISCFKTPKFSKPRKTHDYNQDPEMGLQKDLVLDDSEEESLDLELMRLHNLQGPPRFLTTINEETKEDLESQRSRRGSRTTSLSDLLVKFDTPQASPPLKGSPQFQNLESFKFNPLYEVDVGISTFNNRERTREIQETSSIAFPAVDVNKIKFSPPPTLKFLRDAEEKLLRRLMVESKGKNGIQQSYQVSTTSKVIPLASSPSNN